MSLVFFLSSDGSTRVTMDIETSVKINSPSIVSRSSNMRGQTISDEVIEGNKTISVTGMVTYSKLKSQLNNLDPMVFQEQLDLAQKAGSKFTLYVKDKGQPLLRDYTDCVIAASDVTIGKYLNAIQVTIKFEQIFFSASAQVEYLAPLQKEVDKPTIAPIVFGGAVAKKKTGATIARRLERWIEGIGKPEGVDESATVD